VDGYDNINVGSNPSQYDYTTFDATVEYGITIGEKNTITPGISYQNVDFTDKPYVNPDLFVLILILQSIGGLWQPFVLINFQHRIKLV
jgi:hypothetical protein